MRPRPGQLETEEDDAVNFAEETAWDDQDDLADYPLDELEDELPPARPMAYTPDRKAVVQHAVKKPAPSRQAMAKPADPAV